MWDSPHFEVRDQAGLREELLADAMRAARRNAEAIVSAAPDIEPEDVDAQDSVTVVWELIEG
jgi:uncharacterized protein YggE